MNILLKVPSIACEVCAKTITKTIQNQEPDAQVAVDVDRKTVSVTANATEASIRQAIEKAGHTIED